MNEHHYGQVKRDLLNHLNGVAENDDPLRGPYIENGLLILDDGRIKINSELYGILTREGAWGGADFAQAVAQILDRPIQVITQGDGEWVHRGDSSLARLDNQVPFSRKPLRLLHTGHRFQVLHLWDEWLSNQK